MSIQKLIEAELEEYSEGAYMKHSSARSQLENFAAAVLESRAAELEAMRRQIDALVSAAAYAIPECEHPAQPSPENWAQQIRNLGDDRRAAYKRSERAGA